MQSPVLPPSAPLTAPQPAPQPTPDRTPDHTADAPAPHARTAVAASLTRAVLLAAVVALLNYALWGWFNQPVAAPDAGPRVAGLAYAPFQRWDSPAAAYTGGRFPADASVDADLAQLAAITDQIRTYSAAAMPALPRLAAAHGLRVTLGIWLDLDQANNVRELSSGIRAAQTEPSVTRLLVERRGAGQPLRQRQ